MVLGWLFTLVNQVNAMLNTWIRGLPWCLKNVLIFCQQLFECLPTRFKTSRHATYSRFYARCSYLTGRVIQSPTWGVCCQTTSSIFRCPILWGLWIRLQDTNPCNSPICTSLCCINKKICLVDTISTLGRPGARGLGRPAQLYNWTNSPWCT